MRAPAFVIVCGLLLAGCTVGPKYTRPPAPAPPAFSEPPPKAFTESSSGWQPAHPAEAVLRPDWWQMFGIAELDNLEAKVNVSNQVIKAAEARFREARTVIQQNRAGLYPTVSTGLSVTVNRLSQTASTTRLGTYGQYTLPIDINYEFDAWGRIRRSIAAAREETQATAADLETVRLSLHSELAVDYFELRSLDAQKQLLDDTITAYQKALELTQNRYDGGLATRAEVAQAKTQLETTRAEAIGVTVSRASFQHAIAVLTGSVPEELTLAFAPLNSKPPVIPGSVPSQLLERRPDIAAAERRVAEANEQIGIARTAFFPTLLLTAAGGFAGSSPVNWLTWPSRLWAVGPSVTQLVFDGGRRRAVSESATAAYDEFVANYRESVLEAFQQVEDNLSALRILEEQSQAQRAAVEAAQQSLELSLNRYKGGLVTYLEVTVAQTIALQNQITEVDILRRRMDASVLLIKALGGGWDTSKLPPT
jgi:NodT family efflux transporter outer membrane factor (OMF) lipoprotein